MRAECQQPLVFVVVPLNSPAARQLMALDLKAFCGQRVAILLVVLAGVCVILPDTAT